jgi:multicomponent Na+:H+ antiporter subunit E
MPDSLRAFSFRALALLLLWWMLSDGSGWLFGLAASTLAAALSLRLTPPVTYRLRARRIPHFVAFFLAQSLRAGWDVARRTLHPALPLDPALLRLPLRLPDGAPSWWLMLVISLLPGTLSVQRQGSDLEIHCLDTALDVNADVRHAETQILRLFGLDPSAAPTPGQVAQRQ